MNAGEKCRKVERTVIETAENILKTYSEKQLNKGKIGKIRLRKEGRKL